VSGIAEKSRSRRDRWDTGGSAAGGRDGLERPPGHPARPRPPRSPFARAPTGIMPS